MAVDLEEVEVTAVDCTAVDCVGTPATMTNRIVALLGP